ncbi:MAG: hypothetical protein WA160_16895 [Pseudobdellovibrio sp.]
MFNSLSKFDKRAIIICCICIVAVLYLLSHPELFNQNGNSEKDSIGHVTQVNADIRYKSKQDYFWKKAYSHSYVSKGDSIYTGSKSSTEVLLNDGKILKISENSLVRFTTVDKTLSIDLAFGKVAATGVNKTFTISDCGQLYTVDAKQASFELIKNKECGNFDLKVSKGTVFVDKKQTVKAASKRIITKNILAESHAEKKISFVLPPPVEIKPVVVEEKVVLVDPFFITKSKKMFFKKGTTYSLDWQNVPNADFYMLDIAENSLFAPSSSNKVVATHYDFTPTKGGSFYFKVKAMTNKGVASFPSQPVSLSFGFPSIELNNKFIKAVYKAKNSKDLGQKAKFDVSWSTIDTAEKYLVEVDNDPSFSKPTRFISRRPSSAIPVPQTGNFHYRVSAFDKSGRKISSSGLPGEIDYKKIFNMAQPLLENTVKNMSYYFQKDFAQFIWLKWNSTAADDRKSFRLEISKSNSFSQVDSAFNTRDTKFLIKNKLAGGEYYWRVRSENESQFSDWSDLGRFKITTRK